MTTKFTVTTAAELAAALADISTGADAAANTGYTIALANNIDLATATLALQTGSTLTLNGPGSGIIDTFDVIGTLIDATPITGTIALNGGTLTTQALTDVGGVAGGGAITGSVTGTSSGADAVTNDGSITDTDAASAGITLAAGQVTNGAAGVISAGAYGISIAGAGTVTNDGMVSAAYGVIMGSGDVTNAAQATITGTNAGVVVKAEGAVTNDGTVIGGTGFGVYLNSGDVTNGTASDTAALIDGVTIGGNVGIELGAAGTVSNFGTIGGHVTYGVVMDGAATLTNYAGALIEGGTIGALLIAAGDLSNTGTIEGTGANASGAFFENGGTLTNAAAGTVKGVTFGVAATGQALTVTNAGAVSGNIGVDLEAGGTLGNGDATHAGASVTGLYYGVRILGGAGSVTNFGTITGQVGVSFYSATATSAGIGTIVNAGTISSSYGATGTAVRFGTNTERLVVDPGAVFVGQVEGGAFGGDTTTIEFAPGSTGSFSGLAGTAGSVQQQSGSFDFSAITTLAVDQGASFSVSGTGQFGDLLLAGSLTADTALAITTVEAASTGMFDIAAGATLDLTTDRGAGSAIDFAGAAGVLKIEAVSAFGTGAGTAGYTGPAIEGFATGQVIDLVDLASAGAQITGFDSATGLLQLSSGGTKATLHLTGSFTGEHFHVTADSGVGTQVTVDGTPCYCRGTLILTEQGDRPIETLVIGDRLRTWSGELRPIRWIGRRCYTGHYAADHPDVLPVLIRQGALADGLPRRDLLVSPLHAMFLAGVLVAARDLVDGEAVVQLQSVTDVDYIHLELDSHDVIFAEGAASETFVDDSSRSMFHNSAEYEALYPDAPSSPPRFCAPRIADGPELAAIRAAIAASVQSAPSGAPGRLLGVLDVAEHNRVAGWAQDEADPERPVVLRILDNDALIAEVTANRYRRDLEVACNSSGRHSFNLAIPGGLSRFERHVIRVERAADGAPLGLSPLVLDPCTRFDPDLQRDIAMMLAAVPPGIEQDRALAFLARQTDHLLQRRAEAEGSLSARQAHRRSRGAAAPLQAMDPGKRALVIDDAMPDPARDAGSQAILSHMRALQTLGYAVSFVAAQQFDAGENAAEALTAAGIACCQAPWYGSVEEVLRRQAGCFDAVYLHRVSNASKYLALAREHQPAARVLYSVADLHHVRLARQAAVEARPELVARSRQMRLLELTAVLSADATITHSAAEAALIGRAVHGARIVVAPWHVRQRPGPGPFAERSGVAFVGGFAHPPNVDAARWLVEVIMPLVWRRDPAITCRLAGHGMPDTLRRLARPGLIVMGAVPDLSDVFGQVRLTVAPLRFGAGVKGKVLESLAAGLPCVMTTIAAEGVALPPELLGLVGNTAEAIADTICRLHADPAANRAVGAAGQRLIGELHTEAAVVQALRRAIEGPFAPAGSVTPMQAAQQGAA